MMLRLLLIAVVSVAVDLVVAVVSEVEAFRLAADLIVALGTVNLTTVLVIANLKRKAFLAVVDFAQKDLRKSLLVNAISKP